MPSVPFLCISVSRAWWDWPLTSLTNRRPLVLRHCWLGHVTRKIVSEMTYNVSSGTLNRTIYDVLSRCPQLLLLLMRMRLMTLLRFVSNFFLY